MEDRKHERVLSAIDYLQKVLDWTTKNNLFTSKYKKTTRIFRSEIESICHNPNCKDKFQEIPNIALTYEEDALQIKWSNPMKYIWIEFYEETTSEPQLLYLSKEIRAITQRWIFVPLDQRKYEETLDEIFEEFLSFKMPHEYHLYCESWAKTFKHPFTKTGADTWIFDYGNPDLMRNPLCKDAFGVSYINVRDLGKGVTITFRTPQQIVILIYDHVGAFFKTEVNQFGHSNTRSLDNAHEFPAELEKIFEEFNKL